jgi:hypothetical protein
MIQGVEIALLVIGLLAIIRGKLTISKTKVVTGAAARLLGLIALTPLPVALAAVALYMAVSGVGDPERFADDNRMTLMLIEAGVVIGIAILVFGIGAAIGTDPARDQADEDDEEDDRPRRRRSRRDDDEEDEYEADRPRKRSRRDDDEYDR